MFDAKKKAEDVLTVAMGVVLAELVLPLLKDLEKETKSRLEKITDKKKGKE